MTILNEGGNEFKFVDGSNATKQNASSEEAMSAMQALGQEIDIPLENYAAGSIIYPGAETGDADSVLDPLDFMKPSDNVKSPKEAQDEFREWLGKKLRSAGYDYLEKKDKITGLGKFFKISGDGLTVCTQIPQSEEWFQVDLDISEPKQGKFMLWSRRGEPNPLGTPKDSRAKGAFRHILLTEIGRVIVTPEHPQGLSWSYKNGLLDRATNEVVSKDPDEIADILFGGTASDLDNINTILAKFKQTHSDKYNDVIAKVNSGLEKYKTQYRLKENHPVGTVQWFSQIKSMFA
jgi:hypothetical protein